MQSLAKGLSAIDQYALNHNQPLSTRAVEIMVIIPTADFNIVRK
jgi:hypothetical protein